MWNLDYCCSGDAFPIEYYIISLKVDFDDE